MHEKKTYLQLKRRQKHENYITQSKTNAKYGVFFITSIYTV